MTANSFHAEPDPEGEAIDGFTWGELQGFIHDGVAFAVCTKCSDMSAVEPDARDYDCQLCGAEHSVTSPLVKMNLI